MRPVRPVRPRAQTTFFADEHTPVPFHPSYTLPPLRLKAVWGIGGPDLVTFQPLLMIGAWYL